MANFPLWVVVVIQALCPDSKAPIITLASIPMDFRELLIIPLSIYYLIYFLIQSYQIKTSKVIKASDLAKIARKPWHNHIPFFSVLIILYAVLSMDWSRLDTQNILAMLYTLVLTGGSILTGYMLVKTNQSKDIAYKLLWKITIFIAVIGFIYTILTFFSLLHIGGLKQSVDMSSVGRVKGPFFGVASAYFILIPALGFSIQKILDTPGNKVLETLVCFSLMLTLVGTGSRGAILSFLVFILLIYFSAKDRKKATTLVIALTLSITTALGVYYSKSEKVSARVQSTESIDRVATYTTSMQIMLHRSTKENIFGSGYASYWPWYLPQVTGRNRDTGLVWVPYGEILYKSHSLLLELVIELGIFGLLYYLWLWATLLKLYLKNFWDTKTPWLNCSLLASLICTFFETPLIASPSLSTTWWIFLFTTLFINHEIKDNIFRTKIKKLV